MDITSLVEQSSQYAEKLLSELPTNFSYHNLNHTKEVVAAIDVIAKQEELNENDTALLKIAAWFHDVGHNANEHDHEAESVKIMSAKLSEWGVQDSKIDAIDRIIMSTQIPQIPSDTLSKIICDADLYHLSTDSFVEKSEALRTELNSLCEEQMSEKDWNLKTIEFMANHEYHTSFGKTFLEPGKQENLRKLKKGLKKEKKASKKYKATIAKLEAKLVQAKIQKPDRGIETMFRVTSKNHLQLSAMADNKANIMISINSIILSVLVSVLFRKFGEYPQLILPALLLTTVCLVTIVFAVLATRPNISSGKFTRDEIREKKTNLLFFGNFHGMELDNYMWGMKEMMKDADFLYGSLIKDIYFLGTVLGKKYRMLRKSYNVFMYGFILSILSFVIALILFPETA